MCSRDGPDARPDYEHEGQGILAERLQRRSKPGVLFILVQGVIRADNINPVNVCPGAQLLRQVPGARGIDMRGQEQGYVRGGVQVGGDPLGIFQQGIKSGRQRQGDTDDTGA